MCLHRNRSNFTGYYRRRFVCSFWDIWTDDLISVLSYSVISEEFAYYFAGFIRWDYWFYSIGQNRWKPFRFFGSHSYVTILWPYLWINSYTCIHGYSTILYWANCSGVWKYQSFNGFDRLVYWIENRRTVRIVLELFGDDERVFQCEASHWTTQDWMDRSPSGL